MSSLSLNEDVVRDVGMRKKAGAHSKPELTEHQDTKTLQNINKTVVRQIEFGSLGDRK